MRLPKGSGKNFIDKTNDPDRYIWALRSSEPPITSLEEDTRNGMSDRDLMFLRGVNDSKDLVPNPHAEYFSGMEEKVARQLQLQRQLEILMRDAYMRRRAQR